MLRFCNFNSDNFPRQQQAQRREELLLALKIEEMNEEAEMKERLNLERVFRRRIETRIQLEQQKQENLDRLAREKNDDAEFRAEQLRLLSERDRIDEMTADKRRRMVMEHHRAVREIMDQRRVTREMEKIKLAEEHRYDLEQQEELYVHQQSIVSMVHLILFFFFCRQTEDHRRRTSKAVKRTRDRTYRLPSTRNITRNRSGPFKYVNSSVIDCNLFA